MSIPSIMAHVVCGYPDMQRSLAAATALVAGGARLLELQFPFTDPVADGPVIQEACTAALAAGFHVDDGFKLVRKLGNTTDVEIYIMTYAAIPFAIGIEHFVQSAAAAGAAGLIVPDLPPDCDEGLAAACQRANIESVPVTIADASPTRLRLVGQAPGRTIYVALRRGTTGEQTRIEPQTLQTLRLLGASGKRLWAGFGIHNRRQLMELHPYIDAAVIGSHFGRILRRYADAPPSEITNALRSAVQSLTAAPTG